ncbi:PP2C family serine/threonine-protein phosphatase [Myroides odoratus]|uniref:Protein phosphatase 2C domain-containing protein n=1 Tax=Myroides odoratus TaxID=256 RepID=A0A9Q7E8X4_MYROD|nr:PP2C family serine/threonine-protein phosphatase [Myroides odoratus]EHQ42782.1 hypothetical protein Myrod_1950 [Myroides odoratus DSM 2801]EKB07359.1 hypothetical protein HMPREF9716_01809 [Myroides odoratus CIP 103059]QQU00138.1 protein phosphatase 2C domain-containing protein [Myroides odoratus]WQD57641.1 PP2C family serine/threonine-protein phosphatase [Myroides odoratus]STZ30046.1 Uncharacterised protein [Myroides odoratus]
MSHRFLKYVLEQHTAIDKKLHDTFIDQLLKKEEITQGVEWIETFQNHVIEHFMMYQEIEEFKDEHLTLPHGEVGRTYTFTLDIQQFPHLKIKTIEGLEPLGLSYDAIQGTITGIPLAMTSSKIEIVFSHQKAPTQLEKKSIYFMVNANPKDLWRNLPSDSSSLYAQPDTMSSTSEFLNRKLVAASKRGRSHAHVGAYRDDAYCHIQLTEEWGLLAVADGAGSAPYARQGAQWVTSFLQDYFQEQEILLTLDTALAHCALPEQVAQSIAVTPELTVAFSTCISSLFSNLKEQVKQSNLQLEEIHTTLAFVLCKKIDQGFLFLSYSVGDCPIVIYDDTLQKATVLNKLDVGEFGGGTRFITMKEVHEEPIIHRLHVFYTPHFSYLFAMSDGIYDPKFGTESQLMQTPAWTDFIADLQGENEDDIKVDFNDDHQIAEQLVAWMDFWSKGNHDDRTLIVVY